MDEQPGTSPPDEFEDDLAALPEEASNAMRWLVERKWHHIRSETVDQRQCKSTECGNGILVVTIFAEDEMDDY